MKAGLVWPTVALAMAMNACATAGDVELAAPTTVDPLLAVEDSSGFSRDDPPNQNTKPPGSGLARPRNCSRLRRHGSKLADSLPRNTMQAGLYD